MVEIQTLPAILGVEDLAKLLSKKPKTIIVDPCRAPHRLPPPCAPPGTRNHIWLAEDVLAWLRTFRREVAPQLEPATPARRPGRPTKAEQVRRRRMEALHPKTLND